MKINNFNLPNLITLLAGLCGLFSIILLIRGEVRQAIWMNIIAIVLDFSDGYIARKYGQVSEYGKNLDSLADMVIYLLFDALLALQITAGYTVTGVMTGSLILLFGMMRLARFTEEGHIIRNGKLYYRGLSVAHFSVIFMILSAGLKTGGSRFIIPWFVVSVLLSMFMASNLVVPKVTRPFTLGVILICLGLATFYV